MKTTRIKNFEYDGMFFTSEKCDPVPVEILGVMLPSDPGVVRIKEGDKTYGCPTFALESCPNIDWAKLLTPEQIASREACGMLFGNGTNKKRQLMPLADVPLKP